MSKTVDENRKLLEKLSDVGLTHKEASVYLALLPLRDVGSSKLIRATGLHGQFVYDALNRLEELGLAKHVMQNGRKKFSANAPARILSLLEEKKLSAQAVVKQLKERFAGIHEQNFEAFQGESAFVAHQIDLLERTPEGSTINVIASESERYQSTIEAEGLWDEYTRILKEKHLKTRYLGSEAQRARFQTLEKENLGWTFRVFPGQSTGLMNTDIWHDNITLNMFGNPILSLTITGKDIADGYREFFEALWNLSSK